MGSVILRWDAHDHVVESHFVETRDQTCALGARHYRLLQPDDGDCLHRDLGEVADAPHSDSRPLPRQDSGTRSAGQQDSPNAVYDFDGVE